MSNRFTIWRGRDSCRAFLSARNRRDDCVFPSGQAKIQMVTDVKRIAQRRFALALVFALPAMCCAQSTTVSDDKRQAAISSEQQGRYLEAEAAWRAVLESQPTDAEAYAHLGLLEAQQGHYKEAVPLYRRAIALDPSITGLQLNLGLSLFKSGAMKEAADTFMPLLKDQPPSSPEALRLTTLIGLARYGSGDYAAAVPFLEQATAADPQNLPFRLALAHSCLWSKQYRCVLDVYHQILTLNAESAEADMLAGEALDEMKDKAGAIQQFRAAVKADPKEPNVHFGLGYLLWGQLQLDEAAQEFQAELDNNPDHAQALTYLADCHMKSNKPEAAIPLLEKAIRIDPSIELAHLDLGMLFADAGRPDDALRELKLAVNLNPDDENVHWRLARFYQATGRREEARAEFEKTKSLQKASDQTVMRKLHEAKAKENPPAENPDAQLKK
jgi:tetratricopeptide (TPR) repeat protein